MSIQKFPLASIHKIRRYIQDALAVVETEQQSQTWVKADELPEPESLDDLSGIFAFGGLAIEDVSSTRQQGYWFISTVNPSAALMKLPNLKLKPGLRLVSYLYRNQQEGCGAVFAIPEQVSTMAHLEKALAGSGTAAEWPKPEGCLHHVMEAIDGDHSPGSFILASVLGRELQEFGALGRRCQWGHHRLIDAIPPQVKWQWRSDSPKDLAPKVKVLPDGQAAVEFFTCRVQEPIAIYRHLDQYPAGLYKPRSVDKPIAVIQR